MTILVTGASGFVGSHLIKELVQNKYSVISVSRSKDESRGNVVKKEIDGDTDWSDILKEVDVVIHLANRAHVMDDNEKDAYIAYKKINVDGSLKLASQSIEQGVKRFIYVSSVKANGESTTIKPFNEKDRANPEDAYGKTKFETEDALKALCHPTGMELVIVRPPLVYGPGVKANFLNLIMLCNKNIPLPFGAINNKRSFVFVKNLTSFLELCITHPKAANNTFLISDDDDVSTTQLIKYIKEASGKNHFLLPVPQSWLNFLFKLIGKSSLSNRLCGNLQVDITKAKTLLSWKPPYRVSEGIERTVRDNK
jgi:UDP-glucose 4-epimerase